MRHILRADSRYSVDTTIYSAGYSEDVKFDVDHDPNTIIRAFQNSQSSDVESHSLSVGNLAGADRIGESQRHADRRVC